MEQRPVLYAVACGSPVASYLSRLVGPAMQAGWQVWVIPTPAGCKFADLPTLTAQTGHPVRSEYKQPGDPDLLPRPDAIVVAPATVNTVNKWACGITDTLALGLLVEAYGLGVPVVAMPYTNSAMAAHPAFLASLQRLRSWGVRVLFGPEVVALPPPRHGTRYASRFPWQLALAALGPPRPVPAGRPSPVRPVSPARAGPAGREVRLTPPAIPRRSSAIPRPLVTGWR